ncbi:Mes2.2 family protein [Megaselia abdita]
MEAIKDLSNAQKYKIIEMVRFRPVLWNTNLPDFFHKVTEEKKKAAWDEIGRHLNLLPAKITHFFRSYRSYYRRQLLIQKRAGFDFEPKWEYFKAFDFLKPVMKFVEKKPPNDEYTFFVQQNDFHSTVTSTNQKRKLVLPINGDTKKVKIENVTVLKAEIPSKAPETKWVEESPPQVPMCSASVTNEQEVLPDKKALSFEGIVSDQNLSDEVGSMNSHMEPLVPRAQFHCCFGNVVTAKLNALKDEEANSLMNEIFMILLKY